MKTVLCTTLSFLLLLHLSSHSQNSALPAPAFDTTTYLQDHFGNRIKAFQKEPTHLHAIVFLGNSLTEGGKWEDLFPGQTVLNRGIGGDVTPGILVRIEEVIRHKPSFLFLEIGTNDLSRMYPLSMILDNFKRIILKIQKESPETKLYVQSLLPINVTINPIMNTLDKQTRIQELNQALEELVGAEKGVRFLALYPHFLDKQHNLKKSLTTDGLHLSPKGYKLWKKIVLSQTQMP